MYFELKWVKCPEITIEFLNKGFRYETWMKVNLSLGYDSSTAKI